MATPLMEDERLVIQAAQHGSLAAFNSLVLAYQELCYNVAYRIMGNRDAAADATQDSFVKAYKKLAQYRGGSFRTWLLRIVTNTCYDSVRAFQRRRTDTLDADELDPDHNSRLVDVTPQPVEWTLRREMAEAIQTAVSRLPVDQRAVLVLFDVEGLSQAEIAEIMGVELGTVKSRLSRARGRVRDALLSQPGLLPEKRDRSASRSPITL